jgi:hypothetical protein
MGQTIESGRRGAASGLINADEIAAIIGATRIKPYINVFQLGERLIVIKTGPSAVITEATLSRVDAVFYGEQTDGGWMIYEINPQTYQGLSVPSRSRKHDERYRQVRKTQIRQHGHRVI